MFDYTAIALKAVAGLCALQAMKLVVLLALGWSAGFLWIAD